MNECQENWGVWITAPDQEWASRKRISRLNDEAKEFQMRVQRSMEECGAPPDRKWARTLCVIANDEP